MNTEERLVDFEIRLSRQDDLVEFLLRQLPREALSDLLEQLLIDLSPPDVTPRGTGKWSAAASAD